MSRTAPKRALRRLSWLVAAGLALGCPFGAQAQESLETAVKAAYLYKFAPFVDWPAAAAAHAAGAPFTICVIGADPFGPVLDRAVAGQKVGDRPIAVRRLAAAAHDSPCDIAFLGGSRAQSVKDELTVLHGAPVLTITDGGTAPGVVDFALTQGRVRFRVDDQAAAEDGLTISSKLLSLAVSVRPRKTSGSTP
jgi:hypothetical protein